MEKCKGHQCCGPSSCKCRMKLFRCHQMAMQHEASEKQKQIAVAKKRKIVTTPVIWVLGGPGSGKGTQCDRIVEKYGFAHFSTGDLLRAEVASGSEKGKQLAEIMTEGKLVPNEDVLQLLEIAMRKVQGAAGYLIDGYPREKSQGAAFTDYIAPVDLILYFECQDDTLVKRILERAAKSAVKRADDNEATLKVRIETFRNNTNEILEQYPTLTARINAERDIDTIFNEVSTYIDPVIIKKRDAQVSYP